MDFLKQTILLSLILVTGLRLGASCRETEVSYGDRCGAKASLAWTSKSGVKGALGGDDFVAAFKKSLNMVEGWECTWHHHENVKAMIPVLVETHNRVYSPGSPHTGGATILKTPGLNH